QLFSMTAVAADRDVKSKIRNQRRLAGPGSVSSAGIESRGNHAACVLAEGKDPGECRSVLATRSGRATPACEREYEKSAAEHPAAKTGCRPACAHSRHAGTQRSVCADCGDEQQLT